VLSCSIGFFCLVHVYEIQASIHYSRRIINIHSLHTDTQKCVVGAEIAGRARKPGGASRYS